MYGNIFDSHAHYDDKKFNADRDAVLAALPGQGVRYVMNVGSTLRSSRTAIALAAKYGHVYASAGVHPHDAKSAPDDLEEKLAALLKQDKVCAVGEIGLDYHYDFSPRNVQLDVFERQLQLAFDLELPVIVHDREAHADTLRLLKKYKSRGIVHCFSGSAEMAGELVKMGLYIGFTGVVTFKNARKTLAAAAAVPPDRLLIETDCPYMAPEPNRGRRCDSSMLPAVAERLAQVRGMRPQELIDYTCQNACRVYNINTH